MTILHFEATLLSLFLSLYLRVPIENQSAIIAIEFWIVPNCGLSVTEIWGNFGK